jgi:penicillin-binding protein 1C
VNAIVDGEDRDFWQHRGIEWHSVLGAIRDQLLRHQRRGASTITMQLASLLQQRRSQAGIGAWLDKLAQVRTARALESRWTKPQILEAYLNLLGYQGELQGIGAAAARLAGKTPSGLSVPESLVLAALLPQPGASLQRIIERACARAAHEIRAVDCDSIRASAESLLAANANTSININANANARFSGEALAPQLAQRLLKTPGEQRRTTIDAATQRLARDILAGHLSALASRNVRDGAALVVDNATGEVLAYVGSAGPVSRAAAVDGVQAPRQAGSTLKPFLYEMAIERRYLTAASLLADSPLSLETASGVYLPQDYDHDFKGLVSVRTALASSLNVPAVRTLVLVGLEAFRNRLHDLGYSNITHDGQYYGYSLALGSAEVTLWQQAQAYRTLARGGQWSPITLQPIDRAAEATALLPADASFIVSDILSDPAARAVTFGLDNQLNMPFWASVKTGTSEDMRDNWCIGYSSRFTVAVWVGNFEGDSMHDVSGVTGAAPVWHQLMVALHAGSTSSEPAAPAGVNAQQAHFSPAVEPERREWFLAGTQPGPRAVAAVPQTARPGIESPANGMVIAIDPDIPADHQRVLISVRGAQPGMTLKINELVLGAAAPKRLWAPRPGSYYLTLEDTGGRQLDRILFTVRGAPP